MLRDVYFTFSFPGSRRIFSRVGSYVHVHVSYSLGISIDFTQSPVLFTVDTFPALNIAIMPNSLNSKTVLIAGASSGIGRSTAFEFARASPQNLKLILTARRIDRLNQIAAEIAKEVGANVKVLPVQLDISNADEVRTLVDKLPVEFKEVDVLVNNA